MKSAAVTVDVPVTSDVPFFDATAASVVPCHQRVPTLQWSRWGDVFTPAVVGFLGYVMQNWSAHTQRSTEAGRGTQILDSEDRKPCPGPSQGYSGGPSVPSVVQVWCPLWGVNRSGSLEHLLDWGVSLPRDTGHMQEESISGSHKTYGMFRWGTPWPLDHWQQSLVQGYSFWLCQNFAWGGLWHAAFAKAVGQ